MNYMEKNMHYIFEIRALKCKNDKIKQVKEFRKLLLLNDKTMSYSISQISLARDLLTAILKIC